MVTSGSFENIDSDVYVVNPDGSGLLNVSHLGQVGSEVVWSPDGREIAFLSLVEGNQDIYVVDAGGGAPRNVTRDPAVEFSLAWSPGPRIAFIAYGTDGSPPECYLVDREGKNRVKVTDFGIRGDLRNPAWSPDGARLSFVYDSDIYVADVAGKTLVNITNHDPPLSWDDYAWRSR